MPFARGAKCLLIIQSRNSRAGSSRNIGQPVRSPEIEHRFACVVEIDRGVMRRNSHRAPTGPKRAGSVTVGSQAQLAGPPRGPLQRAIGKGTGFMPLTRGEAVGYDADLMVFKFTMRNGEQIVQCQISNAALGDLAGRWRGAARALPAEFEAHRELIEAIASEQFDQTKLGTVHKQNVCALSLCAPLGSCARGWASIGNLKIRT